MPDQHISIDARKIEQDNILSALFVIAAELRTARTREPYAEAFLGVVRIWTSCSEALEDIQKMIAAERTEGKPEGDSNPAPGS